MKEHDGAVAVPKPTRTVKNARQHRRSRHRCVDPALGKHVARVQVVRGRSGSDAARHDAIAMLL